MDVCHPLWLSSQHLGRKRNINLWQLLNTGAWNCSILLTNMFQRPRIVVLGYIAGA